MHNSSLLREFLLALLVPEMKKNMNRLQFDEKIITHHKGRRDGRSGFSFKGTGGPASKNEISLF